MQNDSDPPVYDLSMTFAGEAPRKVQADDPFGAGDVAVLGRGQKAIFTSPLFVSALMPQAKPVTRFRDADGVWWHLLHDERLEEAPAPAND
ncbi:hypothetical protein ACWERW_35325 [Streptomyces sp. NPDC004012]